MKVLIICSGNAIEGVSPVVRNQGESLKALGIDVEYYPVKGRGIRSYMKHIAYLKTHIKNTEYDLFHAHYSLSAIAATLAGAKPLVVSLMGSDTHTNRIMKSIIKLFARESWAKVIVKSESMKNNIGVNSAVVIPNGVDIKKIKPAQMNGRNDSSNTILFTSNPERPSKNYSLARNALSQLNGNHFNFKIVHSVSHRQIINELNNASMVLLTSRWEGSPNIVKEAMACNVPIVSTDVGDVQWLLGDVEGHYITSFDPEDVAYNIKKALEFSEKKGRTKGRERLIELGLDSETIANKIIDLYNSVLENAN